MRLDLKRQKMYPEVLQKVSIFNSPILINDTDIKNQLSQYLLNKTNECKICYDVLEETITLF